MTISFLPSKDERDLLKQRLLDKQIVDNFFEGYRQGILRQRKGAEKLLEGETNVMLRLDLATYRSYVNDMDILIHVIEAMASNIADQNQTLYKVVKELTTIHRDNDELRKILQDHRNSIKDYEKHREVLDWIDDYIKNARRHFPDDVT